MKADQRLGIDTKADRAFSETRLDVELQAGGRFALVSAAFTLIVIKLQGPRTYGCLGVFNKTSGACLLGQNPSRDGERQCGLLHVPLLSFLIFVFLWSRV